MAVKIIGLTISLAWASSGAAKSLSLRRWDNDENQITVFVMQFVGTWSKILTCLKQGSLDS